MNIVSTRELSRRVTTPFMCLATTGDTPEITAAMLWLHDNKHWAVIDLERRLDRPVAVDIIEEVVPTTQPKGVRVTCRAIVV